MRNASKTSHYKRKCCSTKKFWVFDLKANCQTNWGKGEDSQEVVPTMERERKGLQKNIIRQTKNSKDREKHSKNLQIKQRKKKKISQKASQAVRKSWK